MPRVLIVDDSSFMRRALGHLLATDPRMTIAGAAADGVEALRLVKELRPDVVLLDLQMPQMDGLEALTRIMSECPTPVVVLSGLDGGSAAHAVKALELGAVDFLAKPSGPISYDIDKIRVELLTKIHEAARVPVNVVEPPQGYRVRGATVVQRDVLVVMGGSTGGTRALTALLPRLPQRFPAAVLVVLHIGEEFLPALVQRWGWDCALPVAVSGGNESVVPGKVYLAGHAPQVMVIGTPTGKQLMRGTLNGPHQQEWAIDRAMETAAAVYGPGTLGVLLTGMGQDGVAGLQAIKNAGGRTLVQDPATCLVAGMPSAAIARGLADRVEPLDALALAVVEMVE